jgi:hypothetical protein
MNEISLHILDIVENSTAAGASLINISILEDEALDNYEVVISDNGKGIATEMLDKVTDAFVTSRTTRKVGLGLPLFKQNAEQTGGSFKIESEVGKGTKTTAFFKLNNIDRPPLGDMAGVMTILVGSNPKIDFVYKHKVNERDYVFDTRDVKLVLDDVPISDPEVRKYIKEMIDENLKEIRVSY